MSKDAVDTVSAYMENEPFAFVSYAHVDKQVLPVIRELHQRQYRIWYDEGIEAGADWTENIADRLVESGLVILFVSQAFIGSPHCKRELTYAVSENKPMLCVMLEDVKLPRGIAMQLSTVRKLDAARLSAAEIADAVTAPPPEEDQDDSLSARFLGDGSGYKKRRRRRRGSHRWRTVLLALPAVLLAACAILFFGLMNGWFPFGIHTVHEPLDIAESGANEETAELTVTTFSGQKMMELMLRTDRGAALYLCGSASVNLASEIRYEDGGWYAGSTRVEPGWLEDLSILRDRTLTHLALVDQRLTDAGELADFPELVYLDISGNDIADLSPLRELKELRTLSLRHVPVRDLSILTELPSLRTVVISEELVPLARDILDSGFDVVIRK